MKQHCEIRSNVARRQQSKRRWNSAKLAIRNLSGDVVIGIIERFVEPEKRELLKNPPDSLVILTDLALDSLTMVEIVLAVEDAIGTTIPEEDVQKLQTLGDIKTFIKEKVSQ